MSEYRKGVENIPIVEINTSCPITVLVISVETGIVVEKKQLDYGKYEDRKFLGRISFWAYTNGHSIETMANKDYTEWAELAQLAEQLFCKQ